MPRRLGLKMVDYSLGKCVQVHVYLQKYGYGPVRDHTPIHTRQVCIKLGSRSLFQFTFPVQLDKTSICSLGFDHLIRGAGHKDFFK